MQTELYTIQGVENIFTPALIYYKDELFENHRKPIEIAGGAERLWPHVKSHKMKKMIEMQKAMGIHRFKCATLAEVKMVAECGAEHILLAYPLVGPNIKTFISLVKEFPKTHFYALEDDLSCLHALQAEAEKQNAVLGWFADVNMGMNRTGVETAHLYEFIKAALENPSENVPFSGLHCYDGHVHTTDLMDREAEVTDMVESIADVLPSDEITRPHDRHETDVLGGI